MANLIVDTGTVTIHDNPVMNGRLRIYSDGSFIFDFSKTNDYTFNYNLSYYANYNNGAPVQIASFLSGHHEGGFALTNPYSTTFTGGAGSFNLNGITTLSGNIGVTCESSVCDIVHTKANNSPIPGISFSATLYRAPSSVSGRHKMHENSIEIWVSWVNGTKAATAYGTHVASVKPSQDTDIGSKSEAHGTLKGSGNYVIKPNTNYNLYLWVHDGQSQVFASGYQGKSVWTLPEISDVEINLKPGSEHNTIQVKVKPTVSQSSGDEFSYALNDDKWGDWTSSTTHEFIDLKPHTEYQVWVKMRHAYVENGKTQYSESAAWNAKDENKLITTWYSPLTDLRVILANSWYWYLELSSSFEYDGGPSGIAKYEYHIGDDEDYKAYNYASESHKRGSTSPTGSNKLDYNTNYNCYVKITDTYGRTYSSESEPDNPLHRTFKNAKKVFKTLDERPLYVDGKLREVKVIKPDGSLNYVTPNLLSVIQEDGTVININKVINDDIRTEFK